MIRRDWADAIAAHQGEPCAVCGRDAFLLAQRCAGLRLELAHLVGRKYDLPKVHGSSVLHVEPLAVVTLCGPSTDRTTCHGQFDGHQLDIRPFLTPAQIQWAVDRIGHGPAMRALASRDWT